MMARRPNDHASTQQAHGLAKPSSLLYCPRCGRPNAQDERYCRRCHALLDSLFEQAAQPLAGPRVVRPSGVARRLSVPPSPLPQPHGVAAAISPVLQQAPQQPVSVAPGPAGPGLLRLPPAAPPAYEAQATPAPVALRLAAAALDAALIGWCMALFVLGARLGGMPVVLNRSTLVYYAAAALVLAIYYKLAFSLLNEDTPGLSLLGLQVVRFDRRPLEWQRRLARLAAALLSSAALGAGIWWALLSREQLAWHDLMSRTCVTRSARLPPGRPRNRRER